MKTYVCAFDGSDHAMKAALAAAELAKQTDAELTLVYVVEPYSPAIEVPGYAWIDWLEPLKQAGVRLLNDAADELAKRTGKKPNTEIRVGAPGTEVVHAAEERKADLIVVGSRGLGTVKRVLLGSVADRVVHLSHVPVLVVR
ncbi:MAG: universal stress protein [Myxococcaceae bacterium]|nr:universal stress protein [Myxococcaceae bacterium]